MREGDAGRRQGVASLFYGEYPSTVDSSGRVIIPAPLRKAAGGGGGPIAFVVRYGEDGCLVLYTPDRWAEVEAEMNRAPQKTRSARRRKRLFFSQTGEGRCDRQGRLRVKPATLLGLAGIRKQVVVVGVSDQIEVWDGERWAALRDEMLREGERDAEAYPG